MWSKPSPQEVAVPGSLRISIHICDNLHLPIALGQPSLPVRQNRSVQFSTRKLFANDNSLVFDKATG